MEEGSPQESHSQWCLISPPSTNSDTKGATIQSPQWGQRTGEAKERIAERFAVSLWSSMASASNKIVPQPWWLEAHRGGGATVW